MEPSIDDLDEIKLTEETISSVRPANRPVYTFLGVKQTIITDNDSQDTPEKNHFDENIETGKTNISV